MQQNGAGADLVVQIRGYADQSPRKAYWPEDPLHHRISLMIQSVIKAAGK